VPMGWDIYVLGISVHQAGPGGAAKSNSQNYLKCGR